jgi:hypothetical protein
MALRNNYLPSERLKNGFREVDEAMFQGVKMPCEFFLCISGIEKSELDEVP